MAGFEIIKGGRGNDTLIGGTDNDLILGWRRARLRFRLARATIVSWPPMTVPTISTMAMKEPIRSTIRSRRHGVLIDLRTGQATGLEIGRDAISGFEVAIGGSGKDSFVIGTSAAVLEGGAGADNFEFQLPESGAAELIHQIVDFMVGDRISVSNYQLFEEVVDDLDDQFEQIYGEQDASANALPIKSVS